MGHKRHRGQNIERAKHKDHSLEQHGTAHRPCGSNPSALLTACRCVHLRLEREMGKEKKSAHARRGRETEGGGRGSREKDKDNKKETE